MGALGEFVAMEIEPVGDAAQKGGTGFAGGLRIVGEGFGGQMSGLIEVLKAGGAEDGLDGLAGLRRVRLKAGSVACTAVRTNEGESSEFHVDSSVFREPLPAPVAVTAVVRPRHRLHYRHTVRKHCEDTLTAFNL